jgi:AraC-like DNA-binding protein
LNGLGPAAPRTRPWKIRPESAFSWANAGSADRLIAEIATSCGFDSLATYYRVFNAAYGMAPGDFRARAVAER